MHGDEICGSCKSVGQELLEEIRSTDDTDNQIERYLQNWWNTWDSNNKKEMRNRMAK